MIAVITSSSRSHLRFAPLSDCQGDLVCFQRDGLTPVDGCEGTGVNNYDYCVDSGRRKLLSPPPVSSLMCVRLVLPSVATRQSHSWAGIQVNTFYTKFGGGTYEWSYENKCIPGHNIENIEDITYDECAKMCLACKDDSRCNASMDPCVGIEWFTAGSYAGRCTLSSASTGPPCDNSIYGVQFYSFKELPRGRHGRALTEEADADTKICVVAQNPSALLSGQGGWVHHDHDDELLGKDGFTMTKELGGSTSTISMDIMCTEADHVTLPAITSSNQVYGLCTR